MSHANPYSQLVTLQGPRQGLGLLSETHKDLSWTTTRLEDENDNNAFLKIFFEREGISDSTYINHFIEYSVNPIMIMSICNTLKCKKKREVAANLTR